MTYQQFIEVLTKEIKTEIEDQVVIHTILKNNGIRMKAMSIRRGKDEVCPIIYLAPYYRLYLSGCSIADIIEELKRIFRMNSGNMVDSRIFFSFQLAKPYLSCRILSYGQNQEFLRMIPHRRILDFALIYYLSIPMTDDRLGSSVIFLDHIRAWHISEEDLFEEAMQNMPILNTPRIELVTDVLNSFLSMPDKLPGESCPLYILTNSQNYFGAVNIIYPKLLKSFADEKKCSFYLLPSSVHEFLLLPEAADIHADDLREMVKSVNITQVKPDEILSWNIYRYSREKDEIEIVGETQDE